MTPHVAAESSTGAPARVADLRDGTADEWPPLGPGETVGAVLRLRPTTLTPVPTPAPTRSPTGHDEEHPAR